MLSMETEHHNMKLSARNRAIKSLEGVIAGTVSMDDYNEAVQDYSAVVDKINLKEDAHLANKGE